MHILVATDGELDVEETAEAVARWCSEDDVVTVFTAVNVPTDFLRNLGSPDVKDMAKIALEAGQTLMAGDRAAEHMAKDVSAPARPKQDSPVLGALNSTAESRTGPLVKALADKGITAHETWRSSDYQTAKTIIETVKELDAGLLIVGSHGHGRFEGMLGSTSTKLVRHAPTAVLVLREAG